MAAVDPGLVAVSSAIADGMHAALDKARTTYRSPVLEWHEAATPQMLEATLTEIASNYRLSESASGLPRTTTVPGK